MHNRSEITSCSGTGTHRSWKRGFLLIGGLWRCRACRAIARHE